MEFILQRTEYYCKMCFISEGARPSVNISNKDDSFLCHKWVSNYSLNLLLYI